MRGATYSITGASVAVAAQVAASVKFMVLRRGVNTCATLSTVVKSSSHVHLHAELLVPEELSWTSVTTTCGGAINTVRGVDSKGLCTVQRKKVNLSKNTLATSSIFLVAAIPEPAHCLQVFFFVKILGAHL